MTAIEVVSLTWWQRVRIDFLFWRSMRRFRRACRRTMAISAAHQRRIDNGEDECLVLAELDAALKSIR